MYIYHSFKYVKHLQYAVLISLLLGGTTTAFASCIDSDIRVTVTQNLDLGSVVTPDNGGTSAVGVSPDGVRAIPPELNFGMQNNQSFGNNISAATLSIVGEPGCSFRIDIGPTPSRISNIRLQGINGTALNSSFSGAEGVLSSSGSAEVRLGADVSVNSTDRGSISEAFEITVEAIDASWQIS